MNSVEFRIVESGDDCFVERYSMLSGQYEPIMDIPVTFREAEEMIDRLTKFLI